MTGTFAIIPATAANRGLTAYDWAVLHAIALHADKNGCAYPSLTTIAEVAGIARNNVMRSLKKLEQLGLLERKAERQPGARWSNTRYRIPRNSISGDAIHLGNSISDDAIQTPNSICGDALTEKEETDSLPLRRISIGVVKDTNGLSGEAIHNTGVGDVGTTSRCGFYVPNALGFRLCGCPTVANTDRCAKHQRI